MSKKNAVIVGYGAIGPVHAKSVVRSSFATLYGVCDCDCKKRQIAQREHDCRIYENFEQVISDDCVDAVHICTPHYLHFDMLERAVQNGKSVVIEKPCAMTADELKKIQALADQKNVCAILQNRFNPCVKKMKQIILSGEYGKVVSAKGFLTWMRDAKYYASGQWRGKKQFEGGGVVINQSIHMLDLLEYLGGDGKKIKASIDNRSLRGIIEVEDTAEATITTKDGIRLLFYATNAYAVSSPFDIEIQLERAALKYTYNRLYVVEGESMECVEYDSSETPGKDCWGVGHYELINNFYSTLCGEPMPYTKLKDGIKAAKSVIALYNSADTGKEVILND